CSRVAGRPLAIASDVSSIDGVGAVRVLPDESNWPDQSPVEPGPMLSVILKLQSAQFPRIPRRTVEGIAPWWWIASDYRRIDERFGHPIVSRCAIRISELCTHHAARTGYCSAM